MCLLTVDGSKPFDMQVPQLHTLSNTRARKIVTGKVIRRACPELPIIQNPNSQVQTCEWRSWSTSPTKRPRIAPLSNDGTKSPAGTPRPNLNFRAQNEIGTGACSILHANLVLFQFTKIFSYKWLLTPFKPWSLKASSSWQRFQNKSCHSSMK